MVNESPRSNIPKEYGGAERLAKVIATIAEGKGCTASEVQGTRYGIFADFAVRHQEAHFIPQLRAAVPKSIRRQIDFVVSPSTEANPADSAAKRGQQELLAAAELPHNQNKTPNRRQEVTIN